jgi:hypothetical protein
VGYHRAIRRFLMAAGLTSCFGAAVSSPLAAQGAGPLAPPKTQDTVRLSTTPDPEKPPVPADELIRQFAAKQDEGAQVREGYIYRKTVQLAEITQDGKVSGQAEVTTEYVAGDDGTLRPKTTRKPDSGLQVVDLEPDALQMLSSIPSFPFTTEQLPKYEITYERAEAVDDLMTYVFVVKPKALDREHAYFSGLIWVDNHDLAIVKSYGKWMTETGDMKPPMLPFTFYETYCQPVMNKYWMPAYSRSDAIVKGQNVSIPVRLIIRWDNYQPNPGKSAAAPVPPAPPANSPH